MAIINKYKIKPQTGLSACGFSFLSKSLNLKADPHFHWREMLAPLPRATRAG
jgi:hypothetical protein